MSYITFIKNILAWLKAIPLNTSIPALQGSRSRGDALGDL